MHVYPVKVVISWNGYTVGTFEMLAEALSTAHLLRGLYTSISMNDMMHADRIVNKILGKYKDYFVLSASWQGESYEEIDQIFPRGWWDHDGFVIDGTTYSAKQMGEITAALDTLDAYLDLPTLEEQEATC